MLESGILELHKQEIAVLPFLYDNIQLFSTQARGIGVDLTVAPGTIDLEGHSAGIALLLADSWVARYTICLLDLFLPFNVFFLFCLL